MADAYAFTLAKADSGLAAKRIVGKDDGSREVFPYDRIRHWIFRPKQVAGHDGMASLLRLLAGRQDVMLVMGAPRPDLNLAHAHARLSADPDPRRNTLVDTPRCCLAIDVDDFGVPAPWGLAEHLADAAAAIRDDALGEAFAGVTCVVAATSSTGLAGEDVARLRLFFLLDRAHPIADLHRWAFGARIAGLPVDPAVLQPGQPIFTSRPIFCGTLRDPVPAALRAFVLPGLADRVALDIHAFDQRAADIRTRTRRAESACGDDWRQLLEQTLGGPLSYFEPLTRALGIAARSDVDEAEIVEAVAALVDARADPGRQRQYGPRWIAATLRRFRQRDRRTAGDIAAMRRQLFEEPAP